MKDFELTMRLRNNHLKRRRLELGLSARQISEKIGCGYGEYLRLEGLTASPVGSRGWRPIARAIADFHGVSCETLWPDAVLSVRSPTVSREIDGPEICLLAEHQRNPEEVIMIAESSGLAMATLEWLTPREREVVTGVLDGETFKEIGDRWGIGRERTRQVHTKALGKIRERLRAKPKFRALLEEAHEVLP